MLDSKDNVLMLIGFIGGFSQLCVEFKPIIEVSFYALSTIFLVVGFGFKMYDRFYK